MKSKIEINISAIDDGPVVMRCQGQNTSKGKALDALEDAYLSTVAQLMRKDLSKAEQEEAAKEFGEPIRVDGYTGKRMTFFHDPDGLPLELHE